MKIFTTIFYDAFRVFETGGEGEKRRFEIAAARFKSRLLGLPSLTP
jgi:hypothetical protein